MKPKLKAVPLPGEKRLVIRAARFDNNGKFVESGMYTHFQTGHLAPLRQVKIGIPR